jgi:hypothetical protein
MSILTAKAVSELFYDCLFTKEEAENVTPATEIIRVEGITDQFGFHPGRLESHRDEVRALLAELPDNFQEDKGGGWSFLQACMTKDGDQWGEHIHIQELLTMAIGLNLAKWQFPRSMWKVLPGCMPYVVVLKGGS